MPRKSKLPNQKESKSSNSENVENSDDFLNKEFNKQYGKKNDIKKSRCGQGRRKVEVCYISDKTRRNVSFSKRKRGLLKKAYELGKMTGAAVLLIAMSESGHVYTFNTEIFDKYLAKNKQGIKEYLAEESGKSFESGEDESSEELNE